MRRQKQLVYIVLRCCSNYLVSIYFEHPQRQGTFKHCWTLLIWVSAPQSSKNTASSNRLPTGCHKSKKQYFDSNGFLFSICLSLAEQNQKYTIAHKKLCLISGLLRLLLFCVLRWSYSRGFWNFFFVDGSKLSRWELFLIHHNKRYVVFSDSLKFNCLFQQGAFFKNNKRSAYTVAENIPEFFLS